MGDVDAKSSAPSAADTSSHRVTSVDNGTRWSGCWVAAAWAAVYEAHGTPSCRRRFAIKFLLPEFAANRDVLRRFENEAKAAGESRALLTSPP